MKFRDVVKLILQREGSIIPVTLQISIPCAALSAVLKWLEVNELGYFHILFDLFEIKAAAYASFSSLLGFLVVFRTSQAYNRYWMGGGLMQQMVGSWFDSASSIFAFLHMSKASKEEVRRLEHVVVRLYSILNALALVELEGFEGDTESFQVRLQQLELVDVESLDSYTISTIVHCSHKMELVFHWIQVILIDAINRGVLNVPPPILSRAFMELADGMVKFHDCMKISMLPFPFPYSQATLVLLILHWIITPLVICTWAKNPYMAALFSFLIVFIFWGLYSIATELENPFGDDPNDLDAIEVQREMNHKLLLLIRFEAAGESGPGLDSTVSLQEMEHRAVHKRSTLGRLCKGPPSRAAHFTNLGTHRLIVQRSGEMELMLEQDDDRRGLALGLRPGALYWA